MEPVLDLCEIALAPRASGEDELFERVQRACALLAGSDARATGGRRNLVLQGEPREDLAELCARAKEAGVQVVVRVEDAASIDAGLIQRLRSAGALARLHFDPARPFADTPDLRVVLAEIVAIASPQVPTVALNGSEAAVVRVVSLLKECGFPGVIAVRAEAPVLDPGAGLSSYLEGLADELFPATNSPLGGFAIAEWGDLVRAARERAWTRPADSAGLYTAAADEKGLLFPGSEYLGMPEFVIGDLQRGIDENARRRFRARLGGAAGACEGLPPRYACAGRTLRAAARGEPADHQDCALFQRVIDTGLHLYAAVSSRRPDLIPRDPRTLVPREVSEGVFAVVCVNP